MADPEPTPTVPPTPTLTPPEPDEHAAMAEALSKANAEAKKYRLEAKSHADALEKLQQQSLSDTEKVIKAARDEGLSEGMKSSAVRLVDAEVRAVAAGRPIDVVALLEGLDRTRFVGDDGEPDVTAITKWVDRIAPAASGTPPNARVPIGVRGAPNPKGTPAEEFGAFLAAQLDK